MSLILSWSSPAETQKFMGWWKKRIYFLSRITWFISCNVFLHFLFQTLRCTFLFCSSSRAHFLHFLFQTLRCTFLFCSSSSSRAQYSSNYLMNLAISNQWGNLSSFIFWRGKKPFRNKMLKKHVRYFKKKKSWNK